MGVYSMTYLGSVYGVMANYQGGDGNDLVLTVGVPATAALAVPIPRFMASR